MRRQDQKPKDPCRAGRPRTTGDDGPIDVFESEGDYVGPFPGDRMRMPRDFGPHGPVAYRETTELDILSVVVYRLPATLRR